MITHKDIYEVLGNNIPNTESYQYFGLADSKMINTLTFCDNEKFINQILKNDNISGVFTTNDFQDKFRNHKNIIICKDPRWSFYTLFNSLARKNYIKNPTIIDSSAEIHKTTYVSEYNVSIGKNVIIGPNSTILPDVTIKDNCRVGSNSVLGCDDVEVKNTSQGLLAVFHDGKLILHENVNIGSNCTLVKGIYNQDTIVKSGSFISNNCHIGHRVQIGNNCLILTCSICGGANIGDNVRINPGAIISNQIVIGDNAFVTIGSVVIKDVKANERVSGNFALEHNRFIYKYIKMFGPL